MKTLMLLLIFSVISYGPTDRFLIPPAKMEVMSNPLIVDNIISIIQNDTLEAYEVFKYTYETENGVIKEPHLLIEDLDWELFDRIPSKYPNQVVSYIPFHNCRLIGIQGYHSNPVQKYEALYEPNDSTSITLCFYVLDWDPNVDEVEINYTVTSQRYWR